MAEVQVRSNVREYAFLGGLLLLAGAAGLAASAGWTSSVAPILVFVLIALGGYTVYRWRWEPATPEDSPILWSGPTDVTEACFRVVGAEGPCPRGFGPGDRVEVRRSGALSPVLCDHAASALRRAAHDPSVDVQQWCCPVQDHRLIFEREAIGS